MSILRSAQEDHGDLRTKVMSIKHNVCCWLRFKADDEHRFMRMLSPVHVCAGRHMCICICGQM